MLKFLREWRKMIDFAYSKKKIPPPRESYILKENHEKIEICLRGLLDINKSRSEAGLIVIPYEISSSDAWDDIENIVNLHRHFCGYGSDNTTDMVKYRRKVCKVLINRLTKCSQKGGSYKFVELSKGFIVFDVETFSALKELQKKSDIFEKKGDDMVDEVCVTFSMPPRNGRGGNGMDGKKKMK